VLADPDRFRGVLGSFAARLTVADGYQTAIAAALGAAAEAITVNGLEAAVEVLSAIHAADAGTVGLVIAGPSRPALAGPALPRGGLSTWLPCHLSCPERSGSCSPTSW